MNLLLSYVYKDKIKPLQALQGHNILLDSGAYSVYNSAIEVDLDAYCAYIKNPPFKIWRYFSLDKIGDEQTTERNFQVMLDRGLRPIPVFQRGQHIDKLYRLLDRFDLIGIGGVAGTNDRDEYLKWILSRPDIDKQKLHLLGVMNIDLIRQYKPYSCDSSILINSNKFGRVQYFDPLRNRIVNCGKNDFIKNKYLLSLLRNHEDILAGLMTDEGWRCRPSSPVLTYMAFRLSILAGKDLENRMNKVGCKLFFINPNYAPLNIITGVV